MQNNISRWKTFVYLPQNKVFSLPVCPKNFDPDSDRLLSKNLSELKTVIKQAFWIMGLPIGNNEAIRLLENFPIY